MSKSRFKVNAGEVRAGHVEGSFVSGHEVGWEAIGSVVMRWEFGQVVIWKM